MIKNWFSPHLVFPLFVLTALLLTWPLVWHAGTHLPQGSEHVGTIPLFNRWTLQWNIDQLMVGYPNYWDAPIFAPAKGSFAFSEIQILSAWLSAPLWLSLGSTWGMNFLTWFFLTLNGFFGYGLLRIWGLSRPASLSGGLLIQAMPFVAQEMGVLQLTALFGPLWSLFFLSRILLWSRPPGRADYLALALGLPLTFFTCAYYGLFSLILLTLALLCFGLGQPQILVFIKQRLLGLTIAGVFSLALTLPLVLTQNQILADQGFTRSATTVQANSAKLVHYFQALDYNLLYGQLLGLDQGSVQRLFFGLGSLILAIIGLIWWEPRPQADQQILSSGGRVKLYLGLGLILALLLSFGLNLKLGPWQPYAWLREFVPGFALLRSPYRWAMPLQLHLTLLAALGLDSLWRWAAATWLRRGFYSLILALILLENLALPLPLYRVPSLSQPAWQTWLQTQPEVERVLYLPFAPGPQVTDFEQTLIWMLEHRPLQARMLNGYSGFFPAWHADLRDDMADLPYHQSLTTLCEFEVDYVIVDYSLPKAPPKAILPNYLDPVFADPEGKVIIYSIGCS